MAHDTITRAIADKWTGQRCYLNGAPARIVGRLNDFGIVAPDNPSVPSLEYSWHTINRVMEKGGFFEDDSIVATDPSGPDPLTTSSRNKPKIPVKSLPTRK